MICLADINFREFHFFLCHFFHCNFPFLAGAGVGTVIMSFLLGTYYNVIIAWAIFYLFQSFTIDLPWRNCNTTWAVDCFDDYGFNVTAPNGTKSATEEFFE